MSVAGDVNLEDRNSTLRHRNLNIRKQSGDIGGHMRINLKII